MTPRDIEIFRALARYRYLRSTYLHAFAGGVSEKRFIERLGDLFHEGYLDRPDAQWEFANARTSPVVYELGTGGWRVIEGLVECHGEARTFLGRHAHRQFAHSVMICECLASIELATQARTDLRFVPWPEILAKAPEITRRLDAPFRLQALSGAIVPDSIFGIEYHANGRCAYRFFALEADRGTMPVMRSAQGQTSLVGKLKAYSQFIGAGGYRSHLGVPNLLILTVTSSQHRAAAMVEAFGQVSGERAPFLFKAGVSLSAPCDRLLREPWTRAGLSLILIDCCTRPTTSADAIGLAG